MISATFFWACAAPPNIVHTKTQITHQVLPRIVAPRLLVGRQDCRFCRSVQVGNDVPHRKVRHQRGRWERRCRLQRRRTAPAAPTRGPRSPRPARRTSGLAGPDLPALPPAPARAAAARVQRRIVEDALQQPREHLADQPGPAGRRGPASRPRPRWRGPHLERRGLAQRCSHARPQLPDLVLRVLAPARARESAARSANSSSTCSGPTREERRTACGGPVGV